MLEAWLKIEVGDVASVQRSDGPPTRSRGRLEHKLQRSGEITSDRRSVVGLTAQARQRMRCVIDSCIEIDTVLVRILFVCRESFESARRSTNSCVS